MSAAAIAGIVIAVLCACGAINAALQARRGKSLRLGFAAGFLWPILVAIAVLNWPVVFGAWISNRERVCRSCNQRVKPRNDVCSKCGKLV